MAGTLSTLQRSASVDSLNYLFSVRESLSFVFKLD